MIKKFAPGMWWDTETREIKYSSVCEAIENSNMKHFFPHDYCTSIGAENKQFRFDIINEIHT